MSKLYTIFQDIEKPVPVSWDWDWDNKNIKDSKQKL